MIAFIIEFEILWPIQRIAKPIHGDLGNKLSGQYIIKPIYGDLGNKLPEKLRFRRKSMKAQSKTRPENRNKSQVLHSKTITSQNTWTK